MTIKVNVDNFVRAETHRMFSVNQAEAGGVGQFNHTDVPVDAFWSVSVYNANGFFEPNQKSLYTVNSVTGRPSADGSVTVRFVDSTDREIPANAIFTPNGWNYLIRLYRPRTKIVQGRWTPPALKPSNLA